MRWIIWGAEADTDHVKVVISQGLSNLQKIGKYGKEIGENNYHENRRKSKLSHSQY